MARKAFGRCHAAHPALSGVGVNAITWPVVAFVAVLGASLSVSCKGQQRHDTPSPSSPIVGSHPPQGDETGVYADRVVLGQPAAFSGPSAGLGIEMWRGATAAFAAANTGGGVHGRRIDLVLRDDGYD